MKFLNHNLFTGDITVNGTTTLSTATGITRATGDNSTHLATTAFVKAQGYLTAEVDTLDTVTDRNSVTTNSIGVGTINIIGTTAGAELLIVDGTFGRLFTVTDDLSDSLFSVNTIAGLPVIEVFADNTINLGAFSNPITIDGSSNIVIPGTITASGYNDTNWNTAYNDRIVSAAVSGTTTKTLTLTQTDGGTISTSWTDINTDTDGYISNVSLVGSTLSFTSVGSAFSGIVDLSTLTPTVRTVYETVKNVSGATILKGTPLAVVAGQTSGNVSDVVPANAADPTKMPAVFIANQNIADEAEGEAVLFGNITGINTSAFTSGTTVYVAPGGGWTATKPVHPNLIQNLGVITKQHATNGGGIVTGVGRANALPNLTAGKIWVGSATYPIESTTVHVDEANGRVGIGTSSPASKLHIQQTSAVGYREQLAKFTVSDAGNDAFFINNGTSADNTFWPAFVGYGASTIRSGIQFLGLLPASADASDSADRGILNFEALRTDNATDPSNGNFSAIVNRKLFTWSGFSGPLMTMMPNGNLGIGTTSPTRKLDVNGQLRTDNLLVNAGAGGRTTYVTISAGNSAAEPALQFSNSASTLARIGGISGGGLYFENATTELMRINNAGNVGIGTTAPSYKLDISTTSGTSVFKTLDTTTVYKSFSIDYSSSFITQVNFGLLGRFEYDGGGGVLSIENRSTQAGISTMRFVMGTTERMRITDTGNVGIGTTAPAQRLDVAGIARFRNSTSNYIEIDGSVAGTNTAQISNRFNPLHIITNSGAGVPHINLLPGTAGNVGIGTTAPSEKLHIDGRLRVVTIDNGTGDFATISGTGVITRRTAAQVLSDIGAQASLTNPVTGTGVATRIAFWNSTSELSSSSSLYWDNTNERLGVATSTPEYAVHIQGTGLYYAGAGNQGQLLITTAGSVNREGAFIAASTARSLQFGINDNSTVPVGIDMFEANNDFLGTYINFRVNNADLVRMTNGKVGIGTTAPAYNLDVNGTVGIKGTGTTSATDALVVLNSLGSAYLRVRNDGSVIGTPNTTVGAVWGYSQHISFQGRTLSLGGTINGGSGDWFLNNGAYSVTANSTDYHFNRFANVFNQTSTGTGNVNIVSILPIINQPLGTTITRGLYVNPTLTAASDWRSIEWNNNTGWGLYGAGAAKNYLAGNLGIGTTSPSNKLQVANGNMSITSGYSFILADTDTNWRLGRNIIVESGNYLTASTFQLVAANAVNEGWQFVNDDGFTVLEIGAETSARNVWINAGNLSVGVASPQEKIHVAGNVRIDGGSTAAILETNDATAAEAGTTYRTFTTADHYAVFVDYVVYDAGRANMRTGTFRAVWSTGDVVYTDVSTVDLGATDNVTLTAAISGANVNLIVTGPTDYTLKYSLKVIK